MPTLLGSSDLSVTKHHHASLASPRRLTGPVRPEPSTQTSSLTGGLFVFDWDDTLFPTSAVMAAEAALRPEGALRLYRSSLARHARVVEETLRAAAACSRTCIVTMASRHWFEESAELYLPGLSLRRLLQELNIPVYYAREESLQHKVESMHFGSQKNLKMMAMAKAVNDAYASAPKSSQSLNVVCIGDSDVEHVALRELLRRWTEEGLLLFAPHRKAVKLMERPDVLTLTAELAALAPCLAGLRRHRGDLDISIDSLADFNSAAVAKFSLTGDSAPMAESRRDF